MITVSKPKLIFDPILGLIDVTEILPLIDAPEFQSLGFKYQLGLNSIIFPAATHTRKQHSLGAYERTKRLMALWRAHGFVTEKEAKTLPIYALYHDIGHGPFSHVTESLGTENHNARGLHIIESLQPVIEGSHIDYHFFHELFTEKNPLFLAVRDKNLGMEKFDYLERDAFYTLGERPGVDYISKHIYFIDKKIVIDEAAADQAKAIQEFYIKLSKHAYLRKKSGVLQRMVEKMTYWLVEDGLSEKTLFELTDFGLMGRFEISEQQQVKEWYERFMKGIFPKLAIDIKYESSISGIRKEEKLIEIFGIPESQLNALIDMHVEDPVHFTNMLEKEIAKLADIPESMLMVVPPFSKNRFEPEDVNIFQHNGGVIPLSRIYPNHFEAMKEYGKSHLSFGVAAFPEYRKALFENAKKIKDYIASLGASK